MSDLEKTTPKKDHTMRFTIIDESTATGNQAKYGGTITLHTLVAIASALTVQLNRDVATHWGGAYAVRAGATKLDIMPGEIACVLLDALPDAPGAVAYHDVTGAEVPVVFLARTQCNSLTSGSDSVSIALSHELCETVGDPFVNAWRDDGHGAEYAQELCDACQESGYEIAGISVSDFLLPAFFAPGAKPPYDYLGTVGQGAIARPLETAPGGYQLKRTAGGGETQVFGLIADLRMARKRNPTSRTYRRGARL